MIVADYVMERLPLCEKFLHERMRIVECARTLLLRPSKLQRFYMRNVCVALESLRQQIKDIR